MLHDPGSVVNRVNALRGLFSPHGDAPAASLPASLVHRTPAATSRLHGYVLCGPDTILTTRPQRLMEHLENFVALGIFPSIDTAKAGCMHDRWLLTLTPWRHMVRAKEAVVVTGGSDEDLFTAMCSRSSWQRILLARMLKVFVWYVPWLCVAVDACLALRVTASGFREHIVLFQTAVL
jgi:hypothetical protein